MKRQVNALIKKLTIDEKISLLTGANFWETVGLERLGLKALVLNDGPFGLRKPTTNVGGGVDEQSYPATAFPTTSALAATFDEQLLTTMGIALGKECNNQGVDILLGPGVNIKRSPLCGRNFEYFSEDPLVSGKLGAALVKGIQTNGVSACVKHYAANNQEDKRYTTNAIIDDRALNEIYLKPFKYIIDHAKPLTMMCSYNQLNGMHTSRNHELLTSKLRKEYKYDGLVVSDWGAVVSVIDSVNAGLNLEMPGGFQDHKAITNALANNIITEETINEQIKPLISLMLHKKSRGKIDTTANYEENFALAGKIAEQSAVLLKNNENILPLNQKQKIALIGSFAKTPRYQGSGSSKINPFLLRSLFEEFELNKIMFDYADGYNAAETKIDQNKIKEAVQIAKDAQIVIICAGLPDIYEVEGYDRTTLDMPKSHNELIKAVCAVNKNVVIVLSTGSPVLMPWLADVQAVLLTHLAGSNTGGATFNLLFGKANPSGKLAETFPLSLESTPCYEQFGKGNINVEYRESIFVGYRYYETANVPVLFPFGYGLSYTEFSLDKLVIKLVKDSKDNYEIKVRIHNKGKVRGAEVVQLYLGVKNSKTFRPTKELKAFTKIELAPDESKTITFTLTKEDFNVYDYKTKKWVVEATDYDVFVGNSSVNTPLTAIINITKGAKLEHLNTDKEKLTSYFDLTSQSLEKFSQDDFKTLFNRPLPYVVINKKRPFTLENCVNDMQNYWSGRKLKKAMTKISAKMGGNDPVLKAMILESIADLPFRSLTALSGGVVSASQVKGIIKIANGHYIVGILQVIPRKIIR